MTTRTRVVLCASIAIAGSLLPLPAAAHASIGRLSQQLPLVVYVAGAGIAVALSFVIAFMVAARWRPAAAIADRIVPRPLVRALRAIGLAGWLWIVAQWLVGGSSSAEVGTLFTWVYGWVGIAIASAILAPVWEWLDPFATLHDIGTWVWRRTGIAGWAAAPYPARLAKWPAVAGMVAVVWIELAARGTEMGRVVLLYTAVTLVLMAQFGKQRWRTHGEVFSVWFRTLNRLGRYTFSGVGRVRRQRFPDGLLGRPWDASEVTLVAVASGAILYDGLSQTQPFFDAFGLPTVPAATIILLATLGAVSGAALLAARRVGYTTMGAGLLPISVGYLIAHYLTYLLLDGQRIVIAISDPFQQGWDLFGTAFFEPSAAWLQPAIVWMVMFGAVVGGHILGAWAGHLRTPGDTRGRRAELPLAVVMVGLTVVTLWSLGQAVFRAETAADTSVRVPLSTTSIVVTR
ncbi:MAG: hypothetical protein KF809_08995 [Chloroflexi bacterium]|nr:hypothetical protein [Chloroflexota bacterium]